MSGQFSVRAPFTKPSANSHLPVDANASEAEGYSASATADNGNTEPGLDVVGPATPKERGRRIPGTQAERQKLAKERRRNPRFACFGFAGVQALPEEQPLPAKVLNLSAGGCLIVLEEPHALTQNTTVELTFDVNGQPFRVWGKVRAIRSDRAIGFQFPLLSDRVRTRLESLIEELIEDALTKGFRSGAREKRRYLRIECSGSAGVQLAAGEPVVPAKIVNLSAGGCLMVLEKAQPIAQDMMVELTFHINHLPFRVRGQAKAIRSGTQIGFQFLQVGTRVRREIEDLIDELIENVVKRIAARAELG